MKTIFVPIDFSANTTEALGTASEIARNTGAIVMLMHNIETLVTNWSGLSENEKQKYPEIENIKTIFIENLRRSFKLKF